MRKLKITDIRRKTERLQSKSHSPVDFKCKIFSNDLSELSDCMRIYLMLPAGQSVLRKFGLKLSYWRRRGKLIMFTLQLSNNSMSGGGQARISKR